VGISQIGDSFESGEVFLPELMLAAQAMDAATRVCNAALVAGRAKKGTVIVGTVQGDVHDIGKAIVIAYLKPTATPSPTAAATCRPRLHRPRQRAERRRHRHERPADDHHGRAEEGHRHHQVPRACPSRRWSVRSLHQRWADQIGADAYAEDAADGVKKIDALLGR